MEHQLHMGVNQQQKQMLKIIIANHRHNKCVYMWETTHLLLLFGGMQLKARKGHSNR